MAISSQSKSIETLVNEIRDGKLLLPELQRRYIWKATQVRNLFDSLYHLYPSGQLLVWETDDLPFSRSLGIDGVGSTARRPQLLLDGQQRLTSLAAIMLGRSLILRGSKRPIDIVFNVYTEKFEVAKPIHGIEAGWISLTRFYTQGLVPVLIELKLDASAPGAKDVLDRLNKVQNIKTYMYHVSLLEQLSYEEVTHIFVRINSGGTTLGGADLALAQISSRWRGVTKELVDFQREAEALGLELDTGILIRAISVFLTGQSRPSELFRGDRQQTSIEELKLAWDRVKKGMRQALHFLANNCKADRLELLPTQYILIPLTAFFDRWGTNVSNAQLRELRQWVYMALIWSRYSIGSDTAVEQDINALSKDEPIKAMIQNVEDKVGHRPVSERELQEQRKNSPYMLMSYILARENEAQDWFNGVVIGSNQSLEFHLIFPKEILQEAGYDLKRDSRKVDQVANLAFLSQRPNPRISNRLPIEYLPEIDAARLRAQYVPFDRDVWAPGRFEDFLFRRRTMLADAINKLLQSLMGEQKLWPDSDIQVLESRLNLLEQKMRDVIVERLLDSRGEYAWDYCIPQEIRKSIDRRIEEHLKSNPFDSDKFGSLLSKLELCQFSDYLKIMKMNWPLFQDAFGDVNRFEQHYRTVTDARNALKHNRDLNRSERASAEAGLVWLEECFRVLEEIEADEQANNDESD